MKSAGKVNLPTSTSIFSAIPTRYWNDQSANLTLILVGLRVLRDNLAYNEYGIRLMLAPRSAKALQEKVLLKLHGIRKLLGSPSLGGTLFWSIAELSSLKKAAEIYSILCLFFIFFIAIVEIDSVFRISLLVVGFTTSCEYGIHMLIARLWWLVDFGFVSFWVWLSVTGKRSRRSTRFLVSKSVELGFKVLN
ncbi:hypothetical protein Tco_1333021 [Tanacetum coccineum]